MRPVFRDPKIEEEFQREGYVKLPFIDITKVEKLKKAFFDTLPKSGGLITDDDINNSGTQAITYDFTFIDKNPEYKKLVFDIINEEFKDAYDKILADFKPIIANFIRKKEAGGEVPLHQNWAFVDEHKYTSVSIWCPLVDSTVENGTLQVVPKTHKRYGEFRGPMVPWELEGIKNEIIEKYLVPLETKAGDCVVLDDSIVHYSAINQTPGLRLTIQLILIPAEVPSIHYHLPSGGGNDIQIWEVDKDFYMQFNPWAQPKDMKVVGKVPFLNKPLSEKEFASIIGSKRIDDAVLNPKSESGFFERVRKMLVS